MTLGDSKWFGVRSIWRHAAPQDSQCEHTYEERVLLFLATHFDDVDRHGSQAKSEPGSPGFMAMNGRKFQRFQIQGTITEGGRQALYTQLKSEIKTVLDNNAAIVVGEINNAVRDRPIWYLSMILPSGSPVDLRHLEGFYLEYTTESGNGFVDVMACKSTDAETDSVWEIGFVIHEPHIME